MLVTGGAGFIGANFVRQRAAGHPGDLLVVLDALTYAGDRANLAGAPHVFVHGDIRDTALVRSLLREHALDTIVHFAAESHVDRSIAVPHAFVDTNVVGTHRLLAAARAEWLDAGSGIPHRFHHVSTDEVYGSLGPGDPAFTEASPYAPNSPYAASKAASDHLVRAYHRTYGLQTTLTACSNNYGPYQHAEKLIPLFLRNCLVGEKLPIYGDGMNVRDWLHVEDHCRAIDLALERGRPGEAYNVGGGEELPNLELIDTLCAVVDSAFAADPELARRFPDAPAARGEPSASLKSFVPDRLGHDRRYAINDAKARRALGYAPRRSFTQGLDETIAWYLTSAFPNEDAHVRPLP
jgi:dTDP-glucose 4,6-dehydratase